MSHSCILVKENLLDAYKAYQSYEPQYLSEMFKKPRDEYHTRNSKALVSSCTAQMQFYNVWVTYF